jgi:cytochrome P450
MPRLLQDVGWIARPLPWLERCRARYGDVFTLNIAQEGAWVMLSHPDHVKQVFTGDPAVFHAGEANIVLRPVLGPSSVLLLDDAEHMAQRRLMLPSFHGERMQRYEALMTEVATEEVSRWPAGEPFTLLPRMQSVTLEVIMRAVFGFREPDRLAELRAPAADARLDHADAADGHDGRARPRAGGVGRAFPARPRACGRDADRRGPAAPRRR